MGPLNRLHRGALGGLFAFGCACGLAAPPSADAFCGFYVAGADANLYANATMVVLMRDGTRTVLSMQNNYQGPPEDFALVIPVPSVLNEDQVKVLPDEVFSHVDALSAPRLVEYWERDPCSPVIAFDGVLRASAAGAPTAEAEDSVVIEAQFAVGEYDVVILSASDSAGLDTWLRANDYNIPSGADEVLEPYIAAGTKFFVAKVDPQRVTFKDGQAALSPLRFHYDTPDFSLPVRLGLLNSQGTQDLLVHILASDRYEVANYPNVTIPTNLRVQNEVRDNFGGFYESLFSEVLEQKAGAVVTEYSWDASTCDPCPTPPLTEQDLATLGADVTSGETSGSQDRLIRPQNSYTLTRLHYRYSEGTLGEDLVFKQAAPLVGGRGMPDAKGELENVDAESAAINNFQGRYIILHPWEEAITCQEPIRGQWGGPDGAMKPTAQGSSNNALTGQTPEAASLPVLLAEDLPELEVSALQPLDPFEVRSEPLAQAPVEDEGETDNADADKEVSNSGGTSTGGTQTGTGTTTTGGTSSGADAGTNDSGKASSSAATQGTETDLNSGDDGDDGGCRVGGGTSATSNLLLLLGALGWLGLRRPRRSTPNHDSK